jgi:hypothetical protein
MKVTTYDSDATEYDPDRVVGLIAPGNESTTKGGYGR